MPNIANSDLDIVAHAFRVAFGTSEGTIALAYICQNMCGVDNSLFPVRVAMAGQSAHDVQTYNLARRDVGLEIWKLAMGQTRDIKPEVKT